MKPRHLTHRAQVIAFMSLYAWTMASPEVALATDDAYETHEHLQTTARDFALAHGVAHGLAGATPEIEVAPPDARLRLARCPTPLTGYWPPGARPLGHTRVGVRCATSPDSASGWTVLLPTRIRVMSEVVVAARLIPYNAAITRADLRTATLDLGTLMQGYLTNPQDVVGRKAKTTLAVGVTVVPGLLSAEPLVRRGEKVTVIARAPGYTIRSEAMALADGQAGETLRVRSLSSRRELSGRVTPAGEVEIRL